MIINFRAMNFFNSKKFKIDNSGNSLAIFLKQEHLNINKELINKLKIFSKKNNNCNLRICLHRSKKSKLQNMIVLLNSKSLDSFKIHKHKFKDEVYQIVDGKLKILVFKKNKINKKIILEKNNNLILRLSKNKFHQVLPLSSLVIFHEIREGPFLGQDSIFR